MDDDAVETLRKMLFEADNVVLLIGSGCGEAIGTILQFAALKGTPFVTTPDGKGLVNPQHALFCGVFGFAGHASARAALSDKSVDLILAIGTSMGEWNSGGWCETLLNERLVHIDESEEHLSHTPMARLHVRGRILSVFNRLVEQLYDQNKTGHLKHYQRLAPREPEGVEGNPQQMLAAPGKYRSNATPITPQRLMRELGRRFPPTTRFLADAGNSVAWAVHYLHPDIDRRFGERRIGGGARKISLGQRKSTGGWLRVTVDFAPMGWAIGGAIGTAAANPSVPVVCITGDGSLLMNGQEISAAAAEKLQVIFVVLNDQALGMVKHGQRLAEAEPIAYELPQVDFCKLAAAMGIPGHVIRSPQELDNLDFNALLQRRGPTLLDVRIDPDEVPPMLLRIKTLGNRK